MSNVAVLITSHNRKNFTLSCLESIYLQEISCDIFLVDDGSTDGTEIEVRENYPQVNIIKGDGNLFWNRGMHLAWTVAEENDFDYYLWLNDDTILMSSGIQEMLDLSNKYEDQAIICGTTQGIDTLDFTYGGRDKNYFPLFPDGKEKDVYYMNGNVVLVPKAVYKKVGILDPFFHHDIGDFDYGLRARKKGVKILSSRNYVGFCECNVLALNRERLSGVSLSQRFKRLFSIKGQNPFKLFVFNTRHFNVFSATYVFLRIMIINLIPDFFYLKNENN